MDVYLDDLFIDLVDLYAPQDESADPNGVGEGDDLVYGPLPTHAGVRCYRETKKEIKSPSIVGQTLDQNLFTIDGFHFEFGTAVGSNYWAQFKSQVRDSNGNLVNHPDYGMWFTGIGIAQPLSVAGVFEVLFKRSTAPPPGM